MLSYNELIEKLDNEKFVVIVRGMNKSQIEEYFGPMFSRMYKYDQQNPHHCYDLLLHTAHTVDNIDCAGLDVRELADLKLAALLHDVGKPDAAVWNEKKQRMQFPGHAGKSADIAQDFLHMLGADGDSVNRICFWIREHDCFMNFVPEKYMSPDKPYQQLINEANVKKVLARFARKYGCAANVRNIKLLIRLAIADAMAQAEVTLINGNVAATRKEKIEKLEEINEYIC